MAKRYALSLGGQWVDVWGNPLRFGDELWTDKDYVCRTAKAIGATVVEVDIPEPPHPVTEETVLAKLREILPLDWTVRVAPFDPTLVITSYACTFYCRDYESGLQFLKDLEKGDL